MKIKWKPLLLSLAIPLAVGGLAAFLTRGGMEAFSAIRKPPLSPPMWLFPVVWTILYLLMGFASYLVWNSRGAGREKALAVYSVQLGFNFFWPIFFFSLAWYLFAFFWLLVLWGLILWTSQLFFRMDKTAGYLIAPYLLWVTFAGYLNYTIYLLN